MPLHFETLAVHAGELIDNQSGAVVPPIYLSTTYRRAPDGRRWRRDEPLTMPGW